MTCIERLKQLDAEITDEERRSATMMFCPSHFNIADDPDWCDAPTKCEECWARECGNFFDGFEYIRDWRKKSRVYVTVLDRIENRYTGEFAYKIRRESENGWVDELWCTEKDMKDFYTYRVEEFLKQFEE